jgi:hypothetical protein
MISLKNIAINFAFLWASCLCISIKLRRKFGSQMIPKRSFLATYIFAITLSPTIGIAASAGGSGGPSASPAPASKPYFKILSANDALTFQVATTLKSVSFETPRGTAAHETRVCEALRITERFKSSIIFDTRGVISTLPLPINMPRYSTIQTVECHDIRGRRLAPSTALISGTLASPPPFYLRVVRPSEEVLVAKNELITAVSALASPKIPCTALQLQFPTGFGPTATFDLRASPGGSGGAGTSGAEQLTPNSQSEFYLPAGTKMRTETCRGGGVSASSDVLLSGQDAQNTK